MRFLSHPILRSRVTLLIGFAFIIYLLIILSRVVWQNYQVNQEVALLKHQVETLQASNDELRAQILYYQTPAFQEREARAKLGLQRPGEEVVIVPGGKTPQSESKPATAQKSNPVAWWEFFFGAGY